ncbi:MAG TPA: hypothetical protein VK828_08310 [Terriglobales bacterium]|jgi:hypothetical protein|nr:hypothetical protein [Terriglobales bacterium]
MSRKLGEVLALAGVFALSLFSLSCGSSSYRPAGVLYVLTQGEGGTGNFVSSFSIDLYSGNLSLINSVSDASTCPTLQNTPPVACGIPVNIVMGPGGTTAFVLNQGVPCQPAPYIPPAKPTCAIDPQTGVATVSVPPTIYPYTVNQDGSLSKPGTAVPLNNPTNPQDTEDDAASAIFMGRDVSGQFLFVLDKGSSPSPANSFLNGSVQNCPAPPVANTNFTACPSISVFAMQAGSTTLTPATGSPFYLSKVPSALSTITFTPVEGMSEELLLVTNNHDLNQSQHYDNTVSIYTVSKSGVLTEQVGSPYLVAAVDPISIQAVNTNPQDSQTGGVFVYVGSQNDNAGQLYPFEICTVQNTTCITQQDVNNNLMLPLVQPCSSPPCPNVAPTSAGSYPGQMVVDPTNNFLYVASAFSSQVFGFHINTSAGTLGALAPANSPTGANPVSLVLLPSVNSVGQNFNGYGQFLFVSNNGSSNITGLTLNTTDGAMGNPITVIAPASPSGMAIQ